MAEKVIITIGRQFGSGGKGVAKVLGEKLGIPVYDQEIINAAAEQSGISKEFFMRSDERRHILKLSNLIGSNRYYSSEGGIDDNKLFLIQSEAMRQIAEQGSAIFVGRAADYVLRDMETLDVFLSAPMSVRREIVAQREGKTPEEAEEYIIKKEKARRSYYNYMTLGDNWGVASNYDLCLDSSALGIEATADLIIEFARRAGILK